MNKYQIQIDHLTENKWDWICIYAYSDEEAIKLASYKLYTYQNPTILPTNTYYEIQQKKHNKKHYAGYTISKDNPIFSVERDCNLPTDYDIITQTFIHNKDNQKNRKEGEQMSDLLYEFFYWGDYDKNIQILADMAMPENWEYPGKRENFILKNYLKYTFIKLQDENKITTTDDYVLFNTGLFTPLYDPIYIYGELNKNPDSLSKWYFKGFMTAYDLGEFGIYELPDRADYFSDPSQLIFDPTLKINVQYDHILKDANNLERIQSINSNNIQALLIGEIDKVKKKVAANYQIAIPQWFQNKIQLLLPLCLEDGITPDIALAVTKKNGYYQGHTCITLDMAYNNARLIAKPENNWLTL
jgi:hypothetical protein